MKLNGIALLSFVIWCGCGSSEGGTCQVSSDCASGLECCKQSNAVEARGTCEETCAELVVDAGQTVIDAESDSAEDDAADGAED